MAFAERSTGPKAVTFDVTGTLLECPGLGRIYAEVLERHRCGAVAAEDAARVVRQAWQEIDCRSDPRRCRFRSHPDGPTGFWADFLRRVAALLGLRPPTAFAVAELQAAFARAEAWTVREGAREVLTTLGEQGFALGVISNWDPRLRDLLEDLEMASLFDAVVLSVDLGVEKPHPRLFLRCLKELGTRPGETLHVGDRRLEDLEGARAVGMSALLVGDAGSGDGSGPSAGLRWLLDDVRERGIEP